MSEPSNIVAKLQAYSRAIQDLLPFGVNYEWLNVDAKNLTQGDLIELVKHLYSCGGVAKLVHFDGLNRFSIEEENQRITLHCGGIFWVHYHHINKEVYNPDDIALLVISLWNSLAGDKKDRIFPSPIKDV